MRCIVHLDLDAFYAAVEHVRKNIPKNEPLGVQQWNHLIAVNYPAREFNVKRMHVDEAKKLCPQIHCVHVDTIGDGKFKKAQLGPYRRASVRILDIIKRYTMNFERASIDEVFIDLTDKVQDIDFDNKQINFNDIGTVYGDAPINKSNLSFAHAALIVSQIRHDIELELGYTASAGISSTKVVAKLCSAMHKPNKQTIVTPYQIPHFMKQVPIKKIRMLGGVLGEQLSKHCTAEFADELWDTSLEEIQSWVGESEGSLIYNLVRGIDDSTVIVRHVIKSHMVAKSEKLLTNADLEGVVLVLSLELHERLFDDYELNNRWPKTITLSGSWTNPIQKSKSIKFAPFSEKLSVEDVYNITMNLLRLLKSINGHVIPCFRLSIQLTHLEVVGDRKSFFNKAETKPSFTAPPPLHRLEDGKTVKNEKSNKKQGSVIDLLNKTRVATFYCPYCRKHFPLDTIDRHPEHKEG